MMSSDFFFRDKIPVAILGATGCVGQRFIQLLEQHPWFEIIALCASERSYGKKYGDLVKWHLSTPMTTAISQMEIKPCQPNLPCSLVFSGLDASVAGDIETQFAAAGYVV